MVLQIEQYIKLIAVSTLLSLGGKMQHNYGERFPDPCRFYMIRLMENVWKVGIGLPERPRISLNECDYHPPNYIIVFGMTYSQAVWMQTWVMTNYWKPPMAWFRADVEKYYDDQIVYIPKTTEEIKDSILMCGEEYKKTLDDLMNEITQSAYTTSHVEYPLDVIDCTCARTY